MSALAGPLCCLNVLNVMNANTIFMVGETEIGFEMVRKLWQGMGMGMGMEMEPDRYWKL